MYPFIRLAKEFFVFRNASPLQATDVHISHHICWPWDIDLWMELNNGRTLTFYDLGRLPLARRAGLIKALKDNAWGLTMAGASVRYRRRVRPFERVEMRSRAVGWDDKFIYLEQSMWNKKGECANHILYRSAVTGKEGIVSPEKVLATLPYGIEQQPLPDWIENWIKAESSRPWPPMQDDLTQG